MPHGWMTNTQWRAVGAGISLGRKIGEDSLVLWSLVRRGKDVGKANGSGVVQRRGKL